MKFRMAGRMVLCLTLACILVSGCKQEPKTEVQLAEEWTSKVMTEIGARWDSQIWGRYADTEYLALNPNLEATMPIYRAMVGEVKRVDVRHLRTEQITDRSGPKELMRISVMFHTDRGAASGTALVINRAGPGNFALYAIQIHSPATPGASAASP